MDLIAWVVLGALILGGVSVLGGLIIRRLQRTQKGGAFYLSMVSLFMVFAYGVLPYFSLAGLERAAAYGLGAAVSVLVSQAVFGEKLPPRQ